MSDSTAEQAVVSNNQGKLFHFVFALVFCSLGVVASIAWFAAIGWIVWYLIGWLFG
jgi:hypothetical protein